MVKCNVSVNRLSREQRIQVVAALVEFKLTHYQMGRYIDWDSVKVVYCH